MVCLEDQRWQKHKTNNEEGKKTHNKQKAHGHQEAEGLEKGFKILISGEIAPAGNRTRVCTVAGYYSTTRPPVPHGLQS